VSGRLVLGLDRGQLGPADEWAVEEVAVAAGAEGHVEDVELERLRRRHASPIDRVRVRSAFATIGTR
jgi:hypothetical protein